MEIINAIEGINLIDIINSLINNDPESLLVSCNKLYDAGNEPHQIII